MKITVTGLLRGRARLIGSVSRRLTGGTTRITLPAAIKRRAIRRGTHTLRLAVPGAATQVLRVRVV